MARGHGPSHITQQWEILGPQIFQIIWARRYAAIFTAFTGCITARRAVFASRTARPRGHGLEGTTPPYTQAAWSSRFCARARRPIRGRQVWCHPVSFL
jgi:hypothetical protein